MKNVWIEWEGYGVFPVGKVAVKFRDDEVVEEEDASYWDWNWVTGDRPSEIIAYKFLTDKKPKTERKRPEFTFEDGVYLGQDCGFLAGYLIVSMEYPDLHTTQQQIGAAQEYLKATTWQSDHSFKPLRKKLKLYIKWLQSEMSKQEPSK